MSNQVAVKFVYQDDDDMSRVVEAEGLNVLCVYDEVDMCAFIRAFENLKYYYLGRKRKQSKQLQ